ncbi:hypothetical protein ACFL0Q_01045 [Thermodesulfobacteriota bacterium]
MPPNKRLFFIPIIANALKADDPERAMKEAFDKIKDLGRQAEYREGFDQFLKFIDFTTLSSQEGFNDNTTIYGLIYDLASGEFEGNDKLKEELISAIKNHPTWKAEFERIGNLIQDFMVPNHEIEVEVLTNDEIIGSLPVSRMTATFSHITPGTYTIRLTTGRIVWEEELTREDLIWTYAFPEEDLAVAAETEPIEQAPTRMESILDGELEISVFAGLESGEIRIRVKKR